jgi:hypothetical protein
MIGERVTFDPTESFNSAIGSGQTQGPMVGLGNPQPMRKPQGPSLFDPKVGINVAQPVGSVVRSTLGGVMGGNAQPVRQPQGPRLFDPRVLQPGANVPQPAGTTGMTFGAAQPMRQPQLPRRVRPNRTMGRGAGAFGIRGRSPIPLQQQQVRGRGRGRRR